MRSSISPPDLQVLLHEADIAARRLCRQLRLSRDELADLRQDLLTDLITRFPAFDRQRGSIGAFAGLVMANRATRIAQGVRRHRRIYGLFPVSLDDPLPNGDGATRGDLIAEADGLSAFLGQPVDRVAEAEHRIDFERAWARSIRGSAALPRHSTGDLPISLPEAVLPAAAISTAAPSISA